jgi:hypothetical protein
MRFGVFNKFGAANSKPVFDAFCRALDRLGHHWQPHDVTADVAVIWSVLWAGRMRANQDIWNQFRATGRPVVVLEVGMLQRGHTWKMAINGTGSEATWVPVLDDQRATKLGIDLAPWQPSGTDILIALQRADSQQWHGMPPVDVWIQSVLEQLHKHTDRPIRIRAHPRQRISSLSDSVIEVPVKLLGTYDDFDFDQSLRRAWCVINWNSGPGCRAVIKGVPALVGPGSLAAPVACLDWSLVESPQRPDREQWLRQIAHTEWTCDEIASGVPVSELLGLLQSR